MPKTNQERERKITSFTLDDETRKKLKEKADTTGITQSRIVEKLIQEMAENEKLFFIIMDKIAKEDFEIWATSHNKYLANNKASLFVHHDKEGNMARKETRTGINQDKNIIDEDITEEQQKEFAELMTELYGDKWRPAEK